MDISSIESWSPQEPVKIDNNLDAEVSGHRENEDKMDSLATLSSASLDKELPDLEYVSPESRRVEISEPLELNTEQAKPSPLLGLGIIVGVAGISYLTINTFLR